MEYLNKALAIRKSKLGEEHTDVATSYSFIGVTYCNKEEYSKALKYFDKALPIFLSEENSDDEMISLLYNAKALCYSKLGDTVKAKEYEKKAAEIEQRLK